MFLQRTPKALQELAPGQRQLNQRQRCMLLVAQRHTLSELQAMFGGQGTVVVQELLAQGYLQPASPAPAPALNPAPMNLAAARMYLFDLCERMFANRKPATAEQLHHLLRQARDLPSMIGARDAFLHAVALHAGNERAQSIHRQLQIVLPDPVGTPPSGAT